MSNPVMVLDFTMTIDDLRVPTLRAGRRSWYEWQRRLIALILIWMSASAWRDEHFVFCVLTLIMAAYMMIPSGRSFWWLFRLVCRKQPPMHVRLEIDSVGLHLHSAEHKTHNGWWWSRLTDCEVREGDFWLSFDGNSYPGLYIPDRAFADDEQRTRFRSLVDHPLPKTAIS